jgi:hypothetical protein
MKTNVENCRRNSVKTRPLSTYGSFRKKDVKRIGKLLGYDDKIAYSLMSGWPFEELLRSARLYNLVRKNNGFGHSQMRRFLAERNGTTIEEIANELSISLDDDAKPTNKV